MKLRLVGQADLVRAYARWIEIQCGARANEYPGRNGRGELRVYVDLDDRLVEKWLKQRDFDV